MPLLNCDACLSLSSTWNIWQKVWCYILTDICFPSLLRVHYSMMTAKEGDNIYQASTRVGSEKETWNHTWMEPNSQIWSLKASNYIYVNHTLAMTSLGRLIRNVDQSKTDTEYGRDWLMHWPIVLVDILTHILIPSLIHGSIPFFLPPCLRWNLICSRMPRRVLKFFPATRCCD